MSKIALVLALAFVCSEVKAAPFGMPMGTPASKLLIIKRETQPDTYSVSVPSPNSEFEAYIVYAPPRYGVCKITAIGKDHGGDASGFYVRTAFDGLKSALSSKYGASKDFDFLHSGSIWKDSSDYAMSLRQNERSLDSFWDRKEGSTLPSDIGSILLEGSATGSSTTFIRLGYEYANFPACKAPAEAADKSAL